MDTRSPSTPRSRPAPHRTRAYSHGIRPWPRRGLERRFHFPPRRVRVSPATRTTTPRRRSPPPPRATGRTLSFVSSPPPEFVVFVVVESGRRVSCLPLRLVHDAPTFSDLRRIVRHAHFIMKQLAPRISQELLQLRHSVEQAPGAIQRLNALRQGAQH